MWTPCKCNGIIRKSSGDQGNKPKLSMIPEDTEGEALMAEIYPHLEKLTSIMDENNKTERKSLTTVGWENRQHTTSSSP